MEPSLFYLSHLRMYPFRARTHVCEVLGDVMCSRAADRAPAHGTDGRSANRSMDDLLYSGLPRATRPSTSFVIVAKPSVSVTTRVITAIYPSVIHGRLPH